VCFSDVGVTLSWVTAGPSASTANPNPNPKGPSALCIDCCSDCDSYLTPAPTLALCSDYDGRTALHLAACEGHQGVVSVLLEQASVNINATDRGHRTALQEAIAHRQVRLCSAGSRQ
jgi:ankyrin repeat protein